MSEKEQIEFLGYEWSAKAILRYPSPEAVPSFWDRDSLANRRNLLSSTGAPMDVTEKILAEWPEVPHDDDVCLRLGSAKVRIIALESALAEAAEKTSIVAERGQRLEQALREIIATYLAAAEFTGLYEGRLGVLAEASRNMAHIASGAINDQ